jgi:type I restriction enzyme R subunit
MVMVLSSTTKRILQLESEITLNDFQRRNSCGLNTASGKVSPSSNCLLSARTITTTAQIPRYYQLQAINKTVEAVSAGQKRY